VIVPDVNLLVYAVDSGSPHHTAASAWWRRVLNGPEPAGLPWVCVLALLRLITDPRVFTRPLDAEQALAVVEAWSAPPHVIPVEPTQRHLAILRGLLDVTGTAGGLVTDAHLAALAIEHGATLCSADADFGRFPGLRWRNPLTG